MLSISEKAIRNHLLRFHESIPLRVRADIERVTGYSMLPMERLYDLYMTVAQLRNRNVPGDIVEFGVWKGGALACATLAAARDAASPFDEPSGQGVSNVEPSIHPVEWRFLADENRKIVGFDTFAGHSAPEAWERDVHGKNQREVFDEVMARDGEWAAVSREEVVANLTSILGGQAHTHIELIAGDGAKTSVAFRNTARMRKIALLRLDMDWYSPTKACLENLIDCISPFGAVILDDFGHHNGVQQAAKEFFAGCKRRFDVSRIDYSCMRVTFLD
jgi:O-methyltransferase